MNESMDRVMVDEACDQKGISEVVNSVENSTVVVIRSEEEEGGACVGGENGNLNQSGNSDATVNVLGSSKELKNEEQSCVIDVHSGGDDGIGKLGENLDGERVCRICHLSSDPSLETEATTTTMTITVATEPAVTGLIQLGCDCKDELGNVHTHCAEAWFKLKGNRQCEICGETAKNVTGVADNRFMEEWNETISAGSVTNFSERSGGCWRGQPFCNFLMACLVIAFVLPWFFRVNMF